MGIILPLVNVPDCWSRSATWQPGSILQALFGNGTEDSPNAGLLVGNGFSYDATTCPTGSCNGGNAGLIADNRSVIKVGVNLRPIRSADLIVVLEHGKVVEAGSHEQLLAIDGRYRGLYGDWAEAVAR